MCTPSTSGSPALRTSASATFSAPARRSSSCSTVEARETFAPNGLPIGTELTLQPGGLVLNADVVAHAPVRLVSGDGRVAQFPRAWVSVTTADGRSGVGWVEWNRNL